MGSAFSSIFDTADFPARWMCGTWTAAHGWVHILSDIAIFGAYFAIPLSILFFVSKRRDVPFPPIFWLFAIFIFSCGFGHLVEATIFWHPWYRFSGLVKVVTATVSWATVFVLVRVMPDALALPGLARLNRELESEVQERKAAQAKMSVSLREKETLLQEVNHRVKNNLQMVSSMISLQSSHVASDEAREALQGFQKRIQSIALLHERLYHYENVSEIRLDGYLTELARALSETFSDPRHRVRVAVSADPVVGPIAVALPLGLIVNELVANSLKHGFPDARAGTVNIRLQRLGESGFRLTYADDGIGTKPGFDPSTKRTLGLRLVQIMAQQLHGTLTWAGPPGFGVTLLVPDATSTSPGVLAAVAQEHPA